MAASCSLPPYPVGYNIRGMIALSFVVLLLAADPAPAPRVPAGTHLQAKLQSEVNTGRSKSGQSVVAVLTSPLRESKTVVVPQGSRLNGRVETIQPATHTEEGRVRLVFRDLQFPDGRHVSTWITDSYQARAPKRILRYVVYMTGAGAGTAAAVGHNGRTAGALGGVLLGFVLAGLRDDSNRSDLELRPGKTLHLEFGEDLILPPQSAANPAIH
jgi:hypothetical protein